MNVSYASFPISDTGVINTKTEEIKQYHYNLQQMGIDLNACKCESCRNGIDPLTNKREVNKPPNQFKRIWLPIIITMTILGAILVILLFRWSENLNNLPG